ncbi:hypothetical protein ILUMI_08380 [Ignelater luminosus]|uniref:Uncharacterized protein n=1 Tax=Ignelater luminosus TaxID=2038154 RepID=A0A8K0GH32_IGNLU|nr:hypothetical protein ILUMI_08380 [Ignelater luminosus]
MEFSNKLLMSLKQDIKVLNSVIKEILEKLTCVEFNSWLYPTKTCKESLEVNLLENKPKETRYLDYLELIVDRLYLIINLVSDYMGKFPNIPKQEEHRNIVRPNNLSLGATTSLFWKRVMHLNESLTLNQELSQKKNLQEDIYNITQCGCMNRLTTAIVKDLNNFINLLKDAEDKSKEDDLKIESLNAKYSDSLEIIKNAKSSLKKMQKRSASVKFKNKNLLKSIKNQIEINKENELNLVKERSKIVILEKSIQENVTTVALLSTDNEKLHEDITETLRENVNISSERDLWKSRFSEIYLENRNLNSKIEEMNIEMQSLRTVGATCKELADKLEQYNVEVLQRSKNYENNLKNLTVDRHMRDGNGTPLAECIRKALHVLFAMGKGTRQGSIMFLILDNINSIMQETGVNNCKNYMKISDYGDFFPLSSIEETIYMLLVYVVPHQLDTINLITKAQADSKFLKNEDKDTFQITGDPVADMRRQVEINKLDIERLEKNNVDLMKTIHRVQEQRFIKKFL